MSLKNNSFKAFFLTQAGTVQDLLDRLRKPSQKPFSATYPMYMQAFGQVCRETSVNRKTFLVICLFHNNIFVVVSRKKCYIAAGVTIFFYW